jgi:hypothetical protein
MMSNDFRLKHRPLVPELHGWANDAVQTFLSTGFDFQVLAKGYLRWAWYSNQPGQFVSIASQQPWPTEKEKSVLRRLLSDPDLTGKHISCFAQSGKRKASECQRLVKFFCRRAHRDYALHSDAIKLIFTWFFAHWSRSFDRIEAVKSYQPVIRLKLSHVVGPHLKLHNVSGPEAR